MGGIPGSRIVVWKFMKAISGGDNILEDDITPYVEAFRKQEAGAKILLKEVDDPERFARNARIKGIEIKIDDLPQATIEELLDSSQPQRIQLASLSTARVEITITSAYPGETYDGKEPFPELALKELAFYGRLAPQTSG